MKRKICFLLVIIFLLMTSVPAFAYDKDNARTVLSIIQDDVEQTSAILDNVNAIIQWQVEGSKKTVEDYKAAIAKGETYEDPTSPEEVQGKADELSSYIEQMESLQTEINNLSPLNNEPVDITIEAAKTYFVWADKALKDLMGIFDFYFAEEKALSRLDEYNDNDYQDDLSRIEALYKIVQEVTDNLKTVSCPGFMQNTFNNYIKQINIYSSILETLYYAVSREDVLRYYSANQLMGRMSIQISKHEITLIEQFNLQFNKVGTRLSGKIETLKSELATNCTALLNALAGGNQK